MQEGLNTNRETEDSGEHSQNDEYQDDFDQRYREKSKAYERMDEINKLKQPLKPGKEQIRKDLNPEAVMREYVEHDFRGRKQNPKGQISQQDAKAVILNWAENVLGFDPQEELMVNMFEKITQTYLSKDAVVDYMKKLYQQAGVTGILSRS